MCNPTEKNNFRLLEILKWGGQGGAVHLSEVKQFVQVGQPCQYYIAFWEVFLCVCSYFH